MSDKYAATANIDREELNVRVMEHADLAVVVALDALVFGSTRESYFERRFAVLNDGHADTRAIFLVADYHDAVIGFVMGTLAYGEFGLTQVTAILDTIAVHPRYQRQGVGRQLIEAFVEQGRQQGGAAVYTLVNWKNWTLLNVFHSLGFALASTIPLERQVDGSARESHSDE